MATTPRKPKPKTQKKQQPKSKYSDTSPDPNPGLFVDPRAQRGLDNAHQALRHFFQDIKFSEIDIDSPSAEDLRRDLLEIIRYYWADHDRDHRVKYADMRGDFKRLLVRSQRLQQAIRISHKQTRISLNRLMSNEKRNWSISTDYASAIVETLALLEKVCEPIASKPNVKSAGCGIEAACSKLYDLWKSINKQEFDRTWELTTTPKCLIDVCGLKAFRSQDPRFVQVVLQAVDPELKVGTIRDRLKRAADTKPESKRLNRPAPTKPRSK